MHEVHSSTHPQFFAVFVCLCESKDCPPPVVMDLVRSCAQPMLLVLLAPMLLASWRSPKRKTLWTINRAQGAAISPPLYTHLTITHGCLLGEQRSEYAPPSFLVFFLHDTHFLIFFSPFAFPLFSVKAHSALFFSSFFFFFLSIRSIGAGLMPFHPRSTQFRGRTMIRSIQIANHNTISFVSVWFSEKDDRDIFYFFWVAVCEPHNIQTRTFALAGF